MELPTISPTSIRDLMTCGKRFHELRVMKHWPARNMDFSPTLEFGIAFHKVLASVYAPHQRPLPHLEHLGAVIRTAFFARQYPNEAVREAEMERCTQVLCAYIAQDEDIDATIAVEQSGAFVVTHEGNPLFLLSARLDRILVRDSHPCTLVVRDYKCARPSVSLMEAYVLARTAKLLYPNYKHVVIEFDWIDATGSVERSVVPTSDLKGIDAVVRSRALKVFSTPTPLPEPGEACFACPLLSQCQPQQTVTLDEVLDSEEDMTG